VSDELSRPSDPALAPGAARCPGPSTRELLLADGDGTPEVLLTESYDFLGDEDIAFARYTSGELFARELERVWARTWQWVCREEDLPRVGDVLTYELGEWSFVIARSAPGEIRAYYNSCLHRGMQLVAPGTRARLPILRCPFHGMSWRVDGSLHRIPCRWDFPHVRDESFRLPEVRVARWGGFVFVNMDPAAPPLESQLGVLPRHFERWPLAERRVELHVEKVLPANWKMALEAFLEAYHVLATHPEGLATSSDANTQYDVFDRHVSRFVQLVGHPSPHLERRPSEAELLAALLGEQSTAAPHAAPAALTEGRTARAIVAAQMRSALAAKHGRSFADVSASELLDAIQYFVFPNFVLFPGYSLPMVYRFRPHGMDVDSCVMEILFLAPRSGGAQAPAPIVRLGEGDSFASVPGFPPFLAAIYDQDTRNLARQRAGVKGARKRGQTLGNYQEVRIRHFHQTLDSYLA
jgi:phenylpropionate dioxygenase-like ring-hydroxylating dioxygenase large terminal subunit